MKVARSRYQIKVYQTKFNLSKEPISSPTEEDYKEIISSFIDILASRRGFGVIDPRDMIFAHSGLVHNLKLGDANYNNSIAQVFENIARHCIYSMRNYEIFSHLEILEPDERRQDLPSWVPDWTKATWPPLSIRSLYKQAIEEPNGIFYLSEDGIGEREWWRRFGSLSETGLDPGLFWTADQITHTVENISDILDNADLQPFTDSSDWDESDCERAFTAWQLRLGTKGYMLPPFSSNLGRSLGANQSLANSTCHWKNRCSPVSIRYFTCFVAFIKVGWRRVSYRVVD
jgi:hypothetical protein